MTNTMSFAVGEHVNKMIERGSHISHTAVQDFNGDKHYDILFQNTKSDIGIYNTNGAAIVAGQGFSGPGTDFHIVQAHTFGGPTQLVGDYNGDHTSDILLQDGIRNLVQWTMHNNQV